MKPTTKPTPEQIKEFITKLEEKLLIKAINKRVNFAIKEGYTDCLRILNDRLENPTNDYNTFETEEEIKVITEIYRNQIKGIEKLKTIQGRCISLLCIDYLNGEGQSDTILSLKIK